MRQALLAIAIFIASAVPACAFHEQTARTPTPSPDKFGVLAKRFYSMDKTQQLLYTAGVTDALDLQGIRCPAPVPSYNEIIVATEAYIIRHHDQAEGMWAATAIVGAMAERGCRKH